MRDEKGKTPDIDRHPGSIGEIDDQAPSRRDIPSPRALMRARHPDLFSDTQIDDAPRLPKAVFEYHLDTLTSRKQEYQFEHFCRKLAEKEICPNLRVQTGPTGGGDSKVDDETYPVAEEIAERWWIGSPSAGAERWAFAFSAKKRWKPKVKTDVKNILSTERDYKRIYFFTNQFVRDKDRSAYEDTLLRDAGIPVHIMDRSWIVEKVYEAAPQHLETYLAALGIEDVPQERKSQTGPRDTVRLEELEQLDQQVADSSRYQGAHYQLVEDCLRSAILARGLERSRSEVESRFVQASRLAVRLDHNQQRLRIAYNRAWTAYWWYEDYAEFSEFYEDVEQHAKESVLASDVDLLLNLWMLLLTSRAMGQLETQDAKIEARSQRLATMLEAISTDSTRPNNALQARTSLTLMQTTQALHSKKFDEVENGWRDLTEVVDKSVGLGAYSVERLFKLVRELGEYVDSPAFDTLYDKLADAMRKRCSDGEAGMAYISRAKQKMGQEKPYEAIRWFGRAEELFIKEEYRGQLVMTLLGASRAFEDVGLLWAARNKALAAAQQALASFVEEGQIIPEAMIAMNRLVWIELRLGRIPHILEAITFTKFIASQLNLSEELQKAYAEEFQIQEWVLGIHFLNLPLGTLSGITRLADALKRLGLDHARVALLFVLGYEQTLREEGYFAPDDDPAAVQTFFEQWQDQPAAKDIASQPVLVDGTTSVLKSTILGSVIAVETPSNGTSFGIAESLLSALEAFLATSNEQDVFPHRERMTFAVTSSPQLEGAPQISFPDNDSSRVDVAHAANVDFPTIAERQDYVEWLQNSIAQIASRMLMIRDIEDWLEKIISRERGFARALIFGDGLTLDRNVFGETPRVHLTDWIKQEDQNYPVLRNEPWRKAAASNPVMPAKRPEFGTGLPPTELMDRERLRHTDRRLLSPIDAPLWDRAKWRGTMFAYFPDSDAPPVLGIGFEDGEAGEAIFRGWKNKWGDEDENDDLRLTIITGVSKRNPTEYAVIVGPTLRHVVDDEKKAIMSVSRINRMTPNTSANLDNFIAAYRRAGSYFLVPACIGGGDEMSFAQLAIAKRQLDIREAWQIGEHDPDITVLHEDDEPIVPAGVIDPPCNKALMRIREMAE